MILVSNGIVTSFLTCFLTVWRTVTKVLKGQREREKEREKERKRKREKKKTKRFPRDPHNPLPLHRYPQTIHSQRRVWGHIQPTAYLSWVSTYVQPRRPILQHVCPQTSNWRGEEIFHFFIFLFFQEHRNKKQRNSLARTGFVC